MCYDKKLSNQLHHFCEKCYYSYIITFTGKEVSARYVRLTALRLRQKRLALSKISVMSEGKEISTGCRVSDSESGDLAESVLTLRDRPQGEGIVTNSPGNIIPAEKWKSGSTRTTGLTIISSQL